MVFTQPDSYAFWGSQGLNRFSYTGNNPIRFSDPSGNTREECHGWDYSCQSAQAWQGPQAAGVRYGITFEGDWSDENMWAVILGAYYTGQALAQATGNSSGPDAFREEYDYVVFIWDPESKQNRSAEAQEICGSRITGTYITTSGEEQSCVPVGGYTQDGHHIIFASLQEYFSRMKRAMNVIHELGHAYDNHHGFAPRNSMPELLVTHRNDILRQNPNGGLTLFWQQHPEDVPTRGETFADMFIAWVFNGWNEDPVNLGYVTQAQEFMAGVMP